MWPCLSLRACTCFWQGSMPCFGRIAVIFQSLHGTCPQIPQRRDFADEERLVFFQAMVLSFLGYLLDVA